MNILITGGSSGLGEAIVRKAARDQSVTVFFTYKRSETRARVIEAQHHNTRAIKSDFGNEADIKELIKRIPELNIDVLINNAYTGGFIDTYFHKTPSGNFAAAFEQNILPTIQITQAAINLFRKKKAGKIITVLSAALVNTPPIGASVYAANKAYLQQLAKSWATENIKYNITSNTVSPSFMRTEFTSGVDERIIEQMESNHSLLTPTEAAKSIWHLINASPRVNGTDMLINSGDNIL